ncbi:hypothetical protein B4113_1414 [Geobacillus sp. B4113_201601]|nr:hypothetical protein B4113_1414 [Geobacillus sp. B4113_201601]
MELKLQELFFSIFLFLHNMTRNHHPFSFKIKQKENSYY